MFRVDFTYCEPGAIPGVPINPAEPLPTLRYPDDYHEGASFAESMNLAIREAHSIYTFHTMRGFIVLRLRVVEECPKCLSRGEVWRVVDNEPISSVCPKCKGSQGKTLATLVDCWPLASRQALAGYHDGVLLADHQPLPVRVQG